MVVTGPTAVTTGAEVIVTVVGVTAVMMAGF